MHFRHLATSLSALLALSMALVAGCTPAPPPKVAAVWPVASTEATIAPPTDLLTLPLTGTSADGAVVPTVPVCVKVRDDGLRPVVGVGKADVVYETADVRAGTQLACFYQQTPPPRIGPLAPAGMPDLWLVPQYRAAFFSAGATAGLASSMKPWSVGSDASRGAAPLAYSGSFALGAQARDFADANASTITSQPPSRLRFAESNATTANPIAAVSVPYATRFEARWDFDPVSGTYLRSVNRKPQRDSAGRARISAKNVVVLWARYAAQNADVAGSGGFDVMLGGQGQASVFRDGERFDGKWKADRNTPPRFVAEDGSPIRLAPGNTWFEVIPLSTNITLK